MKKYDVCGIGNAIVDIAISVTFEEISELGFKVGNSCLITLEQKQKLDLLAEQKSLTISSGGSIANSIYAISAFGKKSSFIGTLGKDMAGQGFYKDFLNLDISMSKNIFKKNLKTGTCYVLITPNAERTMLVFLGDCADIVLEDEDRNLIKNSKVLLLEMYPISNLKAYTSLKEAVKIAKSENNKIMMSFSEKWVLELCLDKVKEFANQADFIFANCEEAKIFSNTNDKNSMLEYFKSRKDNKQYIITLGSDGVVLIENGNTIFVDAYKCEPIDLTGAGDMFLASYLYGISIKLSKEESLRRACFMSNKVICQVGARLLGNMKSFWNEFIS